MLLPKVQDNLSNVDYKAEVIKRAHVCVGDRQKQTVRQRQMAI